MLRLRSAQRLGFQLRALSEHREVMAGKTEVVVFNHDFERQTSQEGSPSAANPELDRGRHGLTSRASQSAMTTDAMSAGLASLYSRTGSTQGYRR
jgi:hypothetical protein